MIETDLVKIYEPEYNPEEHGIGFKRYLEVFYQGGSEYRYINGICRFKGDVTQLHPDTYYAIPEDLEVAPGDCMEIITSEEGNPILVIYSEHNLPMSELRLRRRIILNECDWLISRHLSQPDNAKTLSPEQYAELQAYMQALRDLPANADLNNITWPAKPSFI